MLQSNTHQDSVQHPEIQASKSGTLWLVIFLFLLTGAVFSGIGHSLADALALFR